MIWPIDYRVMKKEWSYPPYCLVSSVKIVKIASVKKVMPDTG